MGGIAGILPAEKPVRDIGIQAQLLIFSQNNVAVVVDVGGQDFVGQIILTMTQVLEILPSSLQHGWPMGIILTVVEGLTMDNHLLLAVDEGLAIVPLDDSMGCFHLGRVVIRNVAGNLLPRGSILRLVLLEPLLQTFGLLLKTLHLPVPVGPV